MEELKTCREHWDELKSAIVARGLSYAGSAEELQRVGPENDPLMWAYIELTRELVIKQGLQVLLTPDSECPICSVSDTEIIETVADRAQTKFGVTH